ncbi:LysE family transporter [Chromobacterium sp. TRC.1.1.SA]|uniref:LysE family transporter n=1 Tax=Chromobacterium indicum TaxID=3110228 RepID=A0ABV0CNX9_9NEIS
MAWGLKLLGGFYLLWLAWQSARQAACAADAAKAGQGWAGLSHKQALLRGLLMHLGNPKAILVWLSLVSLAAPAAGGGGLRADRRLRVLSLCAAVFRRGRVARLPEIEALAAWRAGAGVRLGGRQDA